MSHAEDLRIIKYRNFWSDILDEIDAGNLDIEDIRTILVHLKYVHNAPLTVLRACEPHRGDQDCRRFPSTGVPYVMFELRPTGRAPDGEIIVVRYVGLVDVETEQIPDDPERVG